MPRASTALRMPTLRVTTGNDLSKYASNGAVISRKNIVTSVWTGTWGFGARLKNISFFDNIKHTLRINHFRGTNAPVMAKYFLGKKVAGGNYSTTTVGTDFNAGVEGLYLTTRDSATEFSLVNEWQIYKNFRMGAYWLPFFINSFHHRYPRIKIRLVICNSNRLAEKLQSGELEIGFGGSSSGHPNLQQSFLHREPLILVAGKNSALVATHKVLHAGDLLGETILMREQGARMTEKMTRWLKKNAPRSSAPTVVTVDNMEVTKQMVISGIGITALPRHAATKELESGMLVPLPVKEFSMHTNYFLVSLPGAKFSRTIRTFLSMLFEQGVPIPEEMLGE